MPRWKAWQWRLGRPGSAMPSAFRASPGVVFAVTAVMKPSSQDTQTSRAQPLGSSAVEKNKSIFCIKRHDPGGDAATLESAATSV